MIEIIFLLFVLEIVQYVIQYRLIKVLETEIRNANIELSIQKKRIETLSKQIAELKTRASFSEEHLESKRSVDNY